jgi:hypothetical protein
MKILRFVILDLFPYKIRFDCLYMLQLEVTNIKKFSFLELIPVYVN